MKETLYLCFNFLIHIYIQIYKNVMSTERYVQTTQNRPCPDNALRSHMIISSLRARGTSAIYAKCLLCNMNRTEPFHSDLPTHLR